MTLTPGARLGPYEIVALVGSGGMGQVYRGRDTRLDRTVAIKVLAVDPAQQPQLRERFDREARAVSSLNHPHICTLHDVGHADGIDFLVMEFVDGETLASRLTRGPLPVADAIRVAAEAADALARAHAAGIVHRDLKPANIMLTKTGVKLLDFGIASVPVVAENADSFTRTRQAALTQEGMILGTVQYMAPEQLEGKPLDARSDTFSFGAVMYEMIAGHPAFDGQSQAALIAAILNAAPPSLRSVQPLTPVAVDRVVMTCLARDREDRWQSTHDLVRELRWLRDGDTATQPVVTSTSPRGDGRSAAAPLAAALIAGLLLGGGAATWWRSAPATRSVPGSTTRFAVTLPADAALANSDSQSAGAALDISADGSMLVYAIARNGGTQLMLRRLDRLDAAPLRGTEGATAPFFSADGDWIGFFTGGKLWKISVEGGVPLPLATVPPVARGATWFADGSIAVTPTFADATFRVPATGGQLAPLTTLAAGESNHLLPSALPDGKSMLFTVWTGGSFDAASVWLWTAGGERRKLIDSATGARYSSTGHLIVSRGNALLAFPFDLETLTITGSPLAIAENVMANPTNGTAEFAVSATGALVYAMMPSQASGSTLVWVDREGHDEPIADLPGFVERPRLSPDAKRAAVEHLNDLWIFEFETKGFRRATFQGVNQYPVWSHDGKRLAFCRAPSGKPPTLFSMPLDSDGHAEPLTGDVASVRFPNDWSPDGRVLAFADVAGVGQGTDWNVLGWSDGVAGPILNGPFKEFSPTFSPDGHWLAYVSDQSGRREAYVRSYPGAGPTVQVSFGGGDQPRWGRDGGELFFFEGDHFMRAAIRVIGATLVASRPEAMFETTNRHRADEPGYPAYDVSPDGRRFLMIRATHPDAAPANLVVVTSWAEELKRPNTLTRP